VGHVAVVQFLGDFRKGMLIVDQQLFCPFNFVGKNEVLDGCAFDFGKKVRKVIVLVIQLFAELG